MKSVVGTFLQGLAGKFMERLVPIHMNPSIIEDAVIHNLPQASLQHGVRTWVILSPAKARDAVVEGLDRDLPYRLAGRSEY